MTDDEILAAIEAALAAQGRGETVIEPRMHLDAERRRQRPFQRAARLRRRRSTAAGVKIVGDFVDNYKHGLPSELGAAHSCSTRGPACRWRSSTPPTSPTCAPARSPRSAPSIWRARARRCSAISARAAPPTGTCGCSTACSISTRSASIRAGRKAATPSRARLSRDLGKTVVATDDWQSLRRGRRHRRRGLAPRTRRSRC